MKNWLRKAQKLKNLFLILARRVLTEFDWSIAEGQKVTVPQQFLIKTLAL